VSGTPRAIFLIAIASLASSTGCVYCGWGTYPFPSGEGVGQPRYLANPWIDTKVDGPTVTANVQVGTYNPTVVFFGVVVP
jgi:hypothetical protein